MVELGGLGVLKGSVQEPGEKEQEKHILHPSMTLGMLLGREFTNYGELFQEDMTGGEPVSGGRPSYLLNLHEGPTPADRYFLILPRWRTFYDYFAFDAGWRSAIGYAQAATADLDIDPPGLLPGMVITYMRMIAEIQTHRASTLAPEEFEEFCGNDPQAVLVSAWELAAKAISEAIDGSEGPRQRVFQGWILNYLPMACHPWLMPDWLIQRILSRRAVLMEYMRGSNLELRQTLHQRIRVNLGDDWVTPIFEAFREMPDLELDLLRAKHEQSVQLKKRELLMLTPAVDSAQVPSSDLARHGVHLLQEMLLEAQQRESAE